MANSMSMVATELSLDLLRTFQAVYRAGTMTHAAAALGLTQPTVTHQLRVLEQALGQPLFVRRARGVQPTAVGTDLALRLDGALDAVVAIAAGYSSGGGLAGRTLHLGGPAELLTERVLPALAGTVAAGVAVRVRLGLADDLLEELSAGRLDLIVSTVRPRRGGLYVETLCDEEFLLLAAPAVAARVDRSLLDKHPARALNELPLVAYAEDLPMIRRWWRHVLGVPPTTRAVLVVPELRGLLSTAIAGTGATVLPRYLCERELDSGLVEEIYPTDDPPINTVYLASRAAARDQPHVVHAVTALVSQGRLW